MVMRKASYEQPLSVRIMFQAQLYAAAAKSLQLCPTLCSPIDGLQPGSSVPGILQARTLEWVAISFSNAWKWKVKVKSLSRVQLFTTPLTAAYQAPLSMGFSRQEHWSGAPLQFMLTDKTQDVSSSQLDLYIQCNTNQNPRKYSVDNDKLILKFVWRGKRPRIANKILKYNIGERTLPNFKTYCNSIVIKSIGKRKDKWMY